MRFLVTGATGFVGRAVCTELAQRKHDVRRAARNLAGSDGGYFELGKRGVHIRYSSSQALRFIFEPAMYKEGK